MKWAEQDVDHVTFVDISSASIDACRGRYRQLRNRRRYLYSADFHVADCTSALPEAVLRSGPFEVVSCQFAAHYAFESLSQARTLFNNVARCLRPGGFFLATIPNAYEIVRRANEAVHPTKDDIDFGNSIYSIRFQPDICQRTVNSDTCTWGALKFPLFGARYDFQLDGVVDCPEYLVYPPLFEKLAAEHNLLSLTPPIPFSKYFYDTIACTEDRNSHELLIRMGALETWSNPWCTDSDVTKPASSEAEQCKESAYKHVEERIALDDICRHSPSLGTMSDCEWEVVKLYSLVSLQKE